MTTPEALKARQLKALKWLRIEGFILGAVLVVVGLDEWYDEQEENRQDKVNARQEQCLTEQVTELTDALNARAELTNQLNEATGQVIDSFARAAAQQQSGKAPSNTPIIKALENYSKVRDDVAKLRDRTPFPPFPTGKCD